MRLIADCKRLIAALKLRFRRFHPECLVCLIPMESAEFFSYAGSVHELRCPDHGNVKTQEALLQVAEREQYISYLDRAMEYEERSIRRQAQAVIRQREALKY